MKLTLTLTLLLLIGAFSALANTFTVTSNADSGPGSLRDAINQAAVNTAIPNLIIFNIADQSRAGRTITIASSLPKLPSNLTIDGTTQPGTPFGISAARIIIVDANPINNLNCIDIVAVSNVRVYGLFLQTTSSFSGIYIDRSSNVYIGVAGKGNVIQGFAAAILATNQTSQPFITDNIVIQGNILGTDESGTSASVTQLNGTSIYALDITNLQIGGLNPGEGNLMNQSGDPLEYQLIDASDYGYLNIQGNKEGTDITGNIRLSPNNKPFLIGGNVFVGQSFVTTNIINNVSIGGYKIEFTRSRFVIQGNHIGVGLDNVTNLLSGAIITNGDNISVSNCGPGLIGGPDPSKKNYIANNKNGMVEEWCSPVTISQNSFFCNATGIVFDPHYPHPSPYANITVLTPGTVGGTALPNSTIELFYDDDCPGCEGKTYIGTTTADNAGNWRYSLPATGAIVATATDTYGATSAFSTATINTTNIVVQNATCGHRNGSIKNIQVSSGTEWYWQDAAGNVISTSLDLTNIGPGTYTFVTSIGGQACDASSIPYTVTNVTLPAFDPASITVNSPGCGQVSGSLSWSGTFDAATTYSWLNAGGTICPDFSVANPLQGLAPGTYTMQLALKKDPTCIAQYGPYTITSTTAPSLITTSVSVIGTTCGNANGSVTGMSYRNAAPPVFFTWLNDQGATVSTTLDLIHAKAGNYRFVFKDGGGCDTLFSQLYTIPDNGTITFDANAMVINPASCEKPNGSITGIVATNAAVYSWSNTGNGNIVGTAADLTGIAGGVYQLTISNALGCQIQTPVLTVPQIPKPSFDYSLLKEHNDTCNAGIGSISDLQMIDADRTYTWNWYTAGSSVAPIATTAGHLDNLKAGDYKAVVTDQYACTVTSNTLTIGDIELSPRMPQIASQYIPRNTATTIIIDKPQRGEYILLGGPSFGAAVLDTSASGILHTPIIPKDETLYVGFTRGDCSSALVPVAIKVFDSVHIFVPNAFTPNNDGANDRWHLIIQGLTKKIQVNVFDRWGRMVFSSNDPNLSWDGTAGGQPLTGTFVYMLAGVDYYDRSFLLKGPLIIIR
ncbi:T9SS type B sorting domain-containing protein [Niastella vici]|nr:gliding motility-associated C-terminal domain-containing protein [Niastella vici]